MRNVMMAKKLRHGGQSLRTGQSGETVLIVTEASRMSIAECLAEAVCAAGAQPVLGVILPRERDGQEPPECVAAAMKAADVFLCVVGRSITHTQAVKQAVASGARGLVLTHFSEEMMVHGGIEADFPSIAPLCKALAAKLAGG